MKDELGEFPAELRRLPQVDRLSRALPQEYPPQLRVDAARQAIAEAGNQILSGETAPGIDELVSMATARLRAGRRNRLTRVINATGVLLHTNLGRAPLAPEALSAMEKISEGYSNLEYDLEKRSRGSRYDHAASLLSAVTGAESALVVNNNAAAVLLALNALARGREVIVSRGELIEIGGEFRIPDIMAQSGAIMREVGTTNRTHFKDYLSAIGPDTGAIIKVHPSNYKVTGFTSSVPAADLVQLCKERRVTFIHDLGSGLLNRRVAGRAPGWLAGEPTVTEAVAGGADLVTFSGDKLLGGPQAGILAGKEKVVARLRNSPLLRTFRVDKTALAGLEATLSMYLEGREGELPIWRMALAGPGELEIRCEAVVSSVEAAGPLNAKLEVAPGLSTPGGGSAPGAGIPTTLIKVHLKDSPPAGVHAALVGGDPPVISRIEQEAVLLDLRTVDPLEDEQVAAALRGLLCT